jgi:hypothetical protein
MYRDNIRKLICGIDGIRRIYTRCIQVAGIGLVINIGIFPNPDMVICKTKIRINPYGVSF